MPGPATVTPTNGATSKVTGVGHHAPSTIQAPNPLFFAKRP